MVAGEKCSNRNKFENHANRSRRASNELNGMCTQHAMNLFNAKTKRQLCVYSNGAHTLTQRTSTVLTFAERDERTTKYTHTVSPFNNVYA